MLRMCVGVKTLQHEKAVGSSPQLPPTKDSLKYNCISFTLMCSRVFDSILCQVFCNSEYGTETSVRMS